VKIAEDSVARSFQQIADELGTSKRNVVEAYQSAMRKLRARPINAKGLQMAVREQHLAGRKPCSTIYAARTAVFGKLEA
jgi:DNA-binding NarL/FixJ family response regulator